MTTHALLVLATLLPADVSDAPAATRDAGAIPYSLPTAPYIIDVPDVLIIRGGESLALPGRPLAGEYPVRLDGTINLGLCGAVFVFGLTPSEAAAAIADRVAAAAVEMRLPPGEKKPTLALEVACPNAGKVCYVVADRAGAARNVVPVPVGDQGLTVLAAVARFPELGQGRRRMWAERWERGPGKPPRVLPIDWQGIMGGDHRTDFSLLPGDRLYVQADAAKHLGP